MKSLIEPLESRTLLCFSAPVTSAGGGDSISVGDFNKDGRDDIVHFAGSNRVAVSLSNGDGTFRKTSSLSGVTGDPWLVYKPADLNGDGRLDVQAAGYRSLVKTTGRTASTTTVGTAGVPAGACLQGSCGGNQYNGTVYTSTWLGKGDGTFGAATTTSWNYSWLYPTPPANPTSAQADFNRDGIADLAQLDPTGARVSVGNADGTYKAPMTFATGNSTGGAIAAGDFNGDGRADLVVVNSLSSSKTTLSVLFNDWNW